ncbi:MAG: class I SAM-dependent methyltransferase [Nitrospirae bacterium]|nr:MAG: class I SAM-dependent methyltransferase [Nitrospirota bacterium]
MGDSTCEGGTVVEDVRCGLCGNAQASVVCSQRDLLHRVSDEEFTIVRCQRCGLLYLNPRPTKDEIGKYYPVQYFGAPSPPRPFSRVKRWLMEDFYGYPSSEPNGIRRKLRKLTLWPEMLRRSLGGRGLLPWVGRGRLLDVGCGHGVNAAMLAQQGWQVSGLDLGPEIVKQAQTLLGDRVQVGDLLTVRYPDLSFDVVLMSHSLEHMYELFRVLEEARRILDDQGLLVIVVPNAGGLEAKLFGRWWVNWDPPRHLYHFNTTTLTRLLEQAGFSLVRVRTGVTPVHFVSSLERVWMHWLHCRLPAKRLIEKFVARPFCLVAGNLGYGTELIVYAIKRTGLASTVSGTYAEVGVPSFH